MNRTQRLNIGSVLELGRLSLKKSAPIECTTGGGDGAGFDDGDYLAPLTASPPASPATRLGGSSASFFPNTTSGAFQHKSTNSLQQVRSSPKNLNRNGSFAVHNLPKLRESKWFTEEDARIFCVVVEIGFIVEIRRKVELVSVTAADTDNNNNTREYKSLFGVVTRKECINQSAEDKKLQTFKVEITTIDERKKLDKLKLTDVWATNNEIRINNFNDKNKTPHEPKEILDLILFARRSKNLSWHNTEHFSYWCRYGDKPVESVQRRRQVSECIRWGSHAGIGTGMLMLINRRKTKSK